MCDVVLLELAVWYRASACASVIGALSGVGLACGVFSASVARLLLWLCCCWCWVADLLVLSIAAAVLC